jgi:hypothetical protein
VTPALRPRRGSPRPAARGLLASLAAALAAWQGWAADPAPTPAPAAPPAFSGALAAATYCTRCHALPDPALLDRHTWEHELKPRMRVMVGLEPPTAEAGFKDVPLLLAGHAFPSNTVVPEAAFNAAFDHFIKLAPESTRSLQDQSGIRVGLRQFQTVRLPDRHDPPLTSLIRIDASRRRILLGDAGFQGYNVLNAQLGIEEGVKLGNIPTGFASTPDADWFACIGHFFPREEPRGQVLRLTRRPGQDYERKVIVEGLPRTTDLRLADLNGDGRLDFALCAYGNFIGRFSWFEQQDGDRFVEHVLLDQPGALRSEVVDFDRDGKLDLVVLVAQATESLFLYRGDGRGGFTKQTLFQRPPSWGHSGFQLADFDGDGRLDVLVTNGDNADFTTSPPRAHHGLRIYLHRPDNSLAEAWFSPMNGAYQSVVRDFDGDGDLDLAACSFFPDYQAAPRESFIYYENTGGQGRFQYARSTFPECTHGRWLTLDAGDFDGDGDEDLVLGSMIQMPTKVPEFLSQQWAKNGPSLILLRNTLK